MKTLFLLQNGDGYLSAQSLTNVAICDTFAKAIKLAKENAIENDEPLQRFDLDFLKEYKQTQGRDVNFLITEIELNTLL